MKEKRYLLMLFGVFVILGSFASAAPVWHVLDGGYPEGTPPQIDVLAATTDTTTLRVRIPGYWEDSVTTQAMTFTRIFLPATEDRWTTAGMGVYQSPGESGKSEVPVVRTRIAVTSDATNAFMDDIRVNSKTMIFLTYSIYPYQPCTREEASVPFQYDSMHYSSMDIYPFDYQLPSPPTYDYEVGDWHHLRVATVELYPFFVTPNMWVLEVLTDFEVDYDHQQVSGTITPLVCTQLWHKAYSSTVENMAFIDTVIPPPVTSHKEKFRIYVAEGLETNSKLADFILWKKRQGYEVTVRTVGATGDVTNDTASIQTDITNYYNNHPCWDIFVLLVGDYSKIVCKKYSYSCDGSRSGLTDYKYACVKGNDEYADLFIGRFSVDTDSQLNTYVDKIMKYEKNPPQDSWPGRVLVAAHKQSYAQKYTACKESIASASYSIKTPSFGKYYGGASYSISDYAVRTYIGSTHCGIVNYRGHGSRYAWSGWNKAGESFNSSDVGMITNGDYTPVIFSISCLNNKFDVSECIGEYWMLQNATGKKGAVAHLGATNVSCTTPNHEYDRQLFDQIYDEGVYRISPVSNFAHAATMKYYKTYNPSMLAYAKANAHIYCVLGDPSMEIRTDNPRSFTSVTGPSPIKHGSQSYTVTVQDSGGPVQGATVTIEKPAGSSTPEFFVTGKTNALGQVSFNINPSSDGSVYGTVSKHNYIVWQGSISTVVPVEISTFHME